MTLAEYEAECLTPGTGFTDRTGTFAAIVDGDS
jgi:hypothetical protein